ncbi:hypothetical protein HYU95_01930 [Candidatus Daviesbacteria bacterium]|nr:hypothetical protein [Candidatus Daviesbacteria bacterium]
MILLKKLIFAPFFLVIFALLVYKLKSVFISFDFIFTLSPDTLTGLLSFFALPLIISPLTMFASFLFILFASIASDWKIVIPVGIIASLIPMIFLDPVYGLILMVGILVSLLLAFVFLESTLKSYVTFNPYSLLGPQIKNLSIFLILIISFICFLSINKSVPPEGFQISESFLNPPRASSSQPPVSNEQIDLLKENPQILKQFGLDPAILDSLNLSGQSDMTNELVNQTIKDQLQLLIDTLNPYARFIPLVLSVLLFFNLFSAFFILNFFLHLLLFLTFYILEKTGFIKFTTEMREVKKLVV